MKYAVSRGKDDCSDSYNFSCVNAGELFFKWINPYLRIKRFLGTSENAVKTQVWCAIATYVLIAIVKRELHLNSSLYTCLQILSVSVFEKTLISCALQTDDYKTSPSTDVWWSNKNRQNDRFLSNLNGNTSEQQDIPKNV